ncbi:MAG: hypothetical protein WBA28_03295 [Microbacteriaceae bacterium]
MNQTPPQPPVANPAGGNNFDPQTGQPIGQYAQPMQPGVPYTEQAPQGYPQQPYPGQPYGGYGYAPQQPSGAGKFFGWVLDFKLKDTAANAAQQFGYMLVVFSVFAFAIARFVDIFIQSLSQFEYGSVLGGIWILIGNLIAVPVVTLAVLGVARLGFDALVQASKKSDKE